MPLNLTLPLLLEVPQSHGHPPLRSTGHTALPVPLFPSSPNFRGHCQPHISPTAANRHGELEISGLAQAAGAGGITDAAAMSRQSAHLPVPRQAPGQPMSVPGAPVW